ncbi:MAG: DUF1549 domain-containing protein, partial [Planctomycetaceae bacterium]
MRTFQLFVVLSIVLSPRVGYCVDPVDSENAKAVEFFEKDVRPILIDKCYKCHGEEKQSGGLRLTRRDLVLKGGDTGPAIVPGNPEESLLVKAIEYQEELKMPPDGKLAAEEISRLKKWIAIGSPWSTSDVIVTPSDDEWSSTFQTRLDWWSLKPLRETQPPTVRDVSWSNEPVDRFLYAALDTAGLAPAPPAEPEVLLRRLSFVLTGLPPSPQLRELFLQRWQNNSDSACESLVNELLASPHFGEQFARHWMDAVRYTDTYGYESDNPANGSYEYRD